MATKDAKIGTDFKFKLAFVVDFTVFDCSVPLGSLIVVDFAVEVDFAIEVDCDAVVDFIVVVSVVVVSAFIIESEIPRIVTIKINFAIISITNK